MTYLIFICLSIYLSIFCFSIFLSLDIEPLIIILLFIHSFIKSFRIHLDKWLLEIMYHVRQQGWKSEQDIIPIVKLVGESDRETMVDRP
jgi:hypothetical protein